MKALYRMSLSMSITIIAMGNPLIQPMTRRIAGSAAKNVA